MSYYTSVIIITILALVVLSILVIENESISSKKKRLFVYTNLIIALAAIAECSGVHVSGNPDIPRGVLIAAKALDYILTPVTGGALIALMQEKDGINWRMAALFAGNAVFQIVSIFTGWMIVIDDNNVYTHGPAYPVYIALYCFIIVLLFVRMVQYGKKFRKQNRTSLYATIALIVLGVVFQEFIGGELRVAYMAIAFGAAFLFVHYTAFAHLLLEDKISEQQYIIARDPLTGVFSRFAYVEAMKEYDKAMPANLAVFLFDINGLKLANDEIGHEAGDELITGAAQCLQDTFRLHGKVYRIGGDEFVAFAQMTEKQIGAVLESLKKNTGMWTGEFVKTLSISAGYAMSNEHPGLSVEELVKVADEVMYEEKKKYYELDGRNRRR